MLSGSIHFSSFFIMITILHSLPSSTRAITSIFLKYLSDSAALLMKIFLYIRISHNTCMYNLPYYTDYSSSVSLGIQASPWCVHIPLLASSAASSLQECSTPAIISDLSCFELKTTLDICILIYKPFQKTVSSLFDHTQHHKCCFRPCALQVNAKVRQTGGLFSVLGFLDMGTS